MQRHRKALKPLNEVVVGDVFYKMTIKKIFTKPDKKATKRDRKWAIVECEFGVL